VSETVWRRSTSRRSPCVLVLLNISWSHPRPSSSRRSRRAPREGGAAQGELSGRGTRSAPIHLDRDKSNEVYLFSKKVEVALDTEIRKALTRRLGTLLLRGDRTSSWGGGRPHAIARERARKHRHPTQTTEIESSGWVASVVVLPGRGDRDQFTAKSATFDGWRGLCCHAAHANGRFAQQNAHSLCILIPKLIMLRFYILIMHTRGTMGCKDGNRSG